MPVIIILLLLFILKQMLTFDAPTERELTRLDSLFELRVRLWFFLCLACYGITMVIVSGRRTADQQAALHKQDSRNPAPLPNRPDSHMQGLAVDVNGYKDGKICLLKNSTPAAWLGVVRLAAICGLRWGGNFKGYYDGNHFDGL